MSTAKKTRIVHGNSNLVWELIQGIHQRYTTKVCRCSEQIILLFCQSVVTEDGDEEGLGDFSDGDRRWKNS